MIKDYAEKLKDDYIQNIEATNVKKYKFENLKYGDQIM